MAEEELKQEETVEEQPKQEPQQQGGVDYNKVSLIAFILVCVAFTVCWGWWIGGIAGIILTLIVRSKLEDASKADQQPYVTFYRITKIAWWIILIVSIICTVAYFIAFIVAIVGAIAEAAKDANSAVALFLF